jgi:hypothetical protein
MLKLVREWALFAVLGVVLGLGVAWLQGALGIPRNIVGWFWIVLMVAALGYAGWAAWGYYGAVRDEDDGE